MNCEASELGDDFDSSDSEMETNDTDMPSSLNQIDEDNDHLIINKNNESFTSIRKIDPDLVGLQKVDIFLQQLPYFDQIKASGFKAFEEIKRNLTEALVLNELRPGFIHWTNRLIVFIHEYGYFFTKEDHIKLVKLYLNVVQTPNIDLSTVDFCFNALVELLKKYDKINRNELVIEWRPLYEIYMRIHKLDDFSSELAPENLESSTFVSFIRYARIYFDINATHEMLDEWRRLLCPFDTSMGNALESCKLFLPTILYEHETARGYKLWLNEFLNLWTSFNSRHYWDSHILDLFSRVSESVIGDFDWNPFIPYIFSNLLRGFGLPFSSKDSIALGMGSSSTSNNSIAQVFLYTKNEICSIAKWIVCMIGTGSDRNLCMEYIRRLFSTLRSFYYPSNTGSWSSNLFLFLKSLPDALIKRVRNERKEKLKWYDRRVTKPNLINNEDITSFVNCLKDVVFTAIFSKSNHGDAKQAFQYLTFLRSEIMLPPLIDHIYQSLESVIEPHRYKTILNCIISVSREIVTYSRFHTNAQTQMHVIPLITAVLPGLDPNDANKCCLTLQFLQNIFDCIVVCDCQPAVNYRTDLTDYERELCFETNKFEDFIHEFFKKVLYLIDTLAQDTSAESSASAAAASNQFALAKSKNLDESVYQIQLINTIKILIRQSSKPILKIILNKIGNYINGNSFNARSGRILANICGLLAWNKNTGQQAFDQFFNYVYDNLSKIKDSTSHYENVLKDERGDIDISWNLQLLAELTKSNGQILVANIDKINQLISWYRWLVHKESVGYVSYCYRNVITALESVYPVELASVNYSIIYEDEKEFFTQHLPIRDWGCKGDLYNLKTEFHKPTVVELQTALDFAKTGLDISYKFLTDSILTNNPATTSSSSIGSNSSGTTAFTSKEERNRELNYINHILYACSRMLKRPLYPHISPNPDTSVEIGIADTVNKGLGFDLECMNDKEHEYSQLSSGHRELLFNMRKELVEFMIKLAEKCIQSYSNETSLLMLIARILTTASITYGAFVNDFEKSWKNFFQVKNSLKNPLLGKKNSTRPELIQRIMLQYKFRTFNIHTRLNELDMRTIDILFRLSTDSIYAIVRKDAQTQLFSLLGHFPYSSLLIIPKLVDMLNKCNLASASDQEAQTLDHEQLKGCLYLLSGNNSNESFMVKQNWQVISALWPALFKCQRYEKPSIQALLDRIYYKANKDYDSFDNRVKFTPHVLDSVYQLNPSLKAKFANESVRLKRFNERCELETRLIANLFADLVKITKESQLLWKNQSTSLGSISLIFNTCRLKKDLLTTDIIQLLTESLVNDNINVRKVSIDALCIVLKMIKHKKQSREYAVADLINHEIGAAKRVPQELLAINTPQPGYRADNAWHHYNPNFLDDVQLKWDSVNFMDKSYWGYYCWPAKVSVNLNKRQVYALDDETPVAGLGSRSSSDLASPAADDSYAAYSRCIKPLRDRFKNDAAFVEKFIKLNIIEESKGNEKFDKKKFYFFKALFRNFGSHRIVNNLFAHLQILVADKQSQTHECSHKLASEMVSALIRGSKYWPFAELKSLWANMKSLFDSVIENITTETLKLWFSCFSNAFEDQDPRRLTFYMNYFGDLVRKMLFKNKEDNDFVIINPTDPANPSSFQQTTCLSLVAALSQLEWRAQLFWSNLVDLFQANMNHPYKAIREKIGACLTLYYVNEMDYSLGIRIRQEDDFQLVLNEFKMENLKRFVDFLEMKLKQAIELFEFVKEENIDDTSSAAAVVELEYTKSQQHMSAVVFLQTVFSFFGYYMMKCSQPMNRELLRLVPLLCSVDKIAAQDPILKVQLPLIRLSFTMWMLDEQNSSFLLDQFKKVTQYKSWHSRLACLQMLNNYGIFNQFLVSNEKKSFIKAMIINSLVDEQLEVRTAAMLALTGFIHSNFIDVDQDLIKHLKTLSKIKAKKKEAETGKLVIVMSNLIKRHGGILGLCAIVGASPYEIPDYLPDTVTYLCEFTNDPVPIQGSVKKCLSEFRRTHHDNWPTHKEKFDESQLATLADILISPNYYA